MIRIQLINYVCSQQVEIFLLNSPDGHKPPSLSPSLFLSLFHQKTEDIFRGEDILSGFRLGLRLDMGLGLGLGSETGFVILNAMSVKSLQR